MSDSEGGKKDCKTYPNVFITRPTVNKPTLLRFQGKLREYESKSWAKDIASYLSWDFALFQEREIATGGKAIKEQLAGLDRSKFALSSLALPYSSQIFINLLKHELC
ncbi:hypothetical protein [Enterobacter hormaechei]|uniref:hypothetical protein n=1 Tax=Enterobacter hormaechei TaxID=158836 RepID=UPI0023E40653|nr:hypothetical protein [Enterobacter hormaechei]MDF3686018.1 hypothetical protein [Enterobacter hormaechei]